MIQTVLGPIRPDRLGYCQCHEHLFVRKGRPFAVNPAIWMDDPARTVRELEVYRARGGDSLVDAQPVGCGRMAEALAEASERSGVQVIASTGFHKAVYYPPGHWIFSTPAGRLRGLFVGELREGMFADGDEGFPERRTAARAGLVKGALDVQGLDGAYAGWFEAAADACLETGAPLLCHVETGSDPLALVRFLSRRGLPPQSVILCHLDRSHSDPAVHREAARAGAWLEYDTIGRPKYHSDEEEIGLIRRMVDVGFADRILLGLDTTRERLAAYGGAVGLDYLLSVFLPKLRQAGVGEETLGRFMRANPARALALRGKG